MNSIKQNDLAYIAPTYARFDVVLTHGKGALVYDEDEKEYIDLTAGIGVNALGFADDEWVQAIITQAAKLQHTSNLYYTKPCTDVAAFLCEHTGFACMMFANSGAEANEGAIKAARKYAHDHHTNQRYEIITLKNSFHGRTITTLSATGQDQFHQYFDPFTPGFQYVGANDLPELKQAINDHTCAIMLELIQGEGGVLPLDRAYVQGVSKLCKEHDILLIIDEVQTGIGRTGTLFAYEHYGITPDIITVAKGLGNGLPIGGVLLNHNVRNVFGYGDHGTTFGGNPIACAGAMVVLSHMNDTFFAQIREKGDYVKLRVMKMAHVQHVDGMGFMLGITLDIEAKAVVKECIQHGLLLLTAKDKLRLLPPLTISMEQLTAALDILENVLITWEV